MKKIRKKEKIEEHVLKTYEASNPSLYYVNVTVNVSREDVKVDKPVEAAPAPAEAPVEEDKEKAE